MTPYLATLSIDGWHGVISYTVEVLAETSKRYRIRALQRMRLPGRRRWLAHGETALVPKTSVTSNDRGRAAPAPRPTDLPAGARPRTAR